MDLMTSADGFNIALIKSQGQYLSFNTANTGESKIIDLDSLLDDKSIHLLLCPQGELWNELQETLVKFNLTIPVRPTEHFNINDENFKSFTSDQYKEIVTASYEAWVLSNNISLIEEMKMVTHHLNDLYQNDRNTFFEELWFILKRNLGACSLSVIYNDIIMAKKEGEKNKLIQANLSGDISPIYTKGEESEKAIIESYKKDIDQFFQIAEYNKERGQLVAHTSIQDSPIVIMGTVPTVNQLQCSIIKSLFDFIA
jgi:hypothetical protein